jgi:hypothetical protein
MDNLVKARQTAAQSAATSSAETVTYRPGQPNRLRRRLLIGAAAAVLLGGGGVAAWYFLRSPEPTPPTDSAETLLGVSIGDRRQEVVDRLKLTHSRGGNPFALKVRPPCLGNALRTEDLRLPAEALPQLEMYWTDGEKVCVLFFDDRVRAIVAQEPHAGATGRGVHLLGPWLEIYDRYGPEVSFEKQELPQVRPEDRDSHLSILRNDALGVAFECARVKKGDKSMKVTAITLFPSVQNRASNQASPEA